MHLRRGVASRESVQRAGRSGLTRAGAGRGIPRPWRTVRDVLAVALLASLSFCVFGVAKAEDIPLHDARDRLAALLRLVGDEKATDKALVEAVAAAEAAYQGVVPDPVPAGTPPPKNFEADKE